MFCVCYVSSVCSICDMKSHLIFVFVFGVCAQLVLCLLKRCFIVLFVVCVRVCMLLVMSAYVCARYCDVRYWLLTCYAVCVYTLYVCMCFTVD